MITGHLPELFIVLTLALVVFGPKRIPEVASSLGQGIRDFKRGMAHLDEPAMDQSPVAEPVSITSNVSDHRAG